MKEIYKALAKFQEEVPTIHEETKGYNYTYSNLNSIFKVIKPLLKKNDLAFTQLLNGQCLNTVLFHVKSGETIESSVDLPLDVQLKGQNQFQVNGSAITYYRRYSLSAMLGLITDKDIDACGDKDIDACGEKEPAKKTHVVLTDANIKSILEKKTQKTVLEGIKSGKFTATKEQLELLNK